MITENRQQWSIVILLANGFVEQETVACAEKMRANNLPVLLVDVSAGLVTGLHGLKIKPDNSLEELKLKTELPQMLVLPNGSQTHLLTDPRIVRLMDDVVNNNGIIAAMSTAEPFVSRYAVEDFVERVVETAV